MSSHLTKTKEQRQWYNAGGTTVDTLFAFRIENNVSYNQFVAN